MALKRSATETEILSNADYLPHRYDEIANGFRFVHVPRDIHRQSTFITDEHLPDVDHYQLIGERNIQSGSVKAAPVHFIFHAAYCCSTMLARAFDIEGVAMGLKEPVVLNDMIGWKRRGARDTNYDTIIDKSLTLLSRPFSEDEAIIIKPSNICTPLALPMMRLRPQSKAILLYAPIESYLQSIAKKEMWGRIWVRDVLLGTRKDGYLIDGFTDDDLLRLTDLQVAALGWLSQRGQFADIVKTVGPERVKLLDSDTFLANQSEVMALACKHFELDIDQSQLAGVMAGRAFNSHSKSKLGFDAAARKQEQEAMDVLHGEEIKMVATWIEAVAQSQNVKLDSSANLFGN